MDTNVGEPILSAKDIRQSFAELMMEYEASSRAITATLVAFLGLERYLRLAAAKIGQSKSSIQQQAAGRLDWPATKTLLAGLDTVGLVAQSQARLLREKLSFTDEETLRLMGVSAVLVAYGLCLFSVGVYLKDPRPSWKDNARTLAIWSFHYADRAAVEWGNIELGMQRFSPLDEVTRRLA